MHRFSSRFREGRRSRPATYRLLVERLEDRLPPGDAVTAGLLAGSLIPAGRPEGLSLAEVRIAPPNPSFAYRSARRLPGPGPFDLTGAFTLPAEPTPAATTRDGPQLLSAAEEPFSPTPAPRHQLVAPPTDAVPRPVDPVVAGPVLAGSASVSANVFVALPPSHYQLDQVVAAVVAPVPEPDDLPAADFDTGPGVQASGVRALFDLGHPTTGPFPSNVFTVPDRSQNTGRRVSMPFPDCKVLVSDCRELTLLNELDGFNMMPRLSVPFDGPIDVQTVNSSTVFLVSLGSTLPDSGYMPRGTVVGINQIVWDVETTTLHVISDDLLAQHTRFALLVTNGIRDADGDRVGASPEFRRFRQTAPREYKRELLDAIHEARRLGVRERDIVTASVFTTQSATALLEKIRDQIKAETPEPPNFLLGPGGSRTVFPFEQVTGITNHQQRRTDTPDLTPVTINISLLRDVLPGAVGQLAFGKYVSPDYMVHPGEYIPPVSTRTGVPQVQGYNEIYFDLVLPSGPKPEGGWPVTIMGHGGGNNNKDVYMAIFGAHLAQQGVATLFINHVAFGFGALSTLTVDRTSGGPITFPSGGRSIDQNGDQVIANGEGAAALEPRRFQGTRDGSRQTAVDFMQLVRVIEVGMDADGDGSADLNPARISYYGGSSAAGVGIPFAAVEPRLVAAGFANIHGPGIEGGRMSPAVNRQVLRTRLPERVPPLLNKPGITAIDGVPAPAPYFNENKPLRDGAPLRVRLEDGTEVEVRSPLVNTVPGAMAIQEYIDRLDWVLTDANLQAYMPHLARWPLPGATAKPVLWLFGKGDQTTPNPGASRAIRAGDLTSRATFYRHDLAYAEDPRLPKDPHGFPNFIASTPPLWAQIARGAQEQIATFFASDGKEIIHPEPKQFFEVPIQGPLPEELNFIP